MSAAITTAQLDWQTDDNGITVPTSSQFGDVYFSKTDGLAESRYVFIDGNHLPERLANLADYQRFVIGEIGFGTGLNVLAIWALWQKVKPDNHSHLHIITTEKFPLTKADLTQALSVWGELAELSQQLIANYPPPLAGCHRLNFFDERLTLDIWLGDAAESLSQVLGSASVNAWLLDGFAPTCNQELWSQALFAQMARLSTVGTTLATFSVASVVKQGLKHHGFVLAKKKGFGKKREMLTACLKTKAKKPLYPLATLSFYFLNANYLAKRLGQAYNRVPFAAQFFLTLKHPPKHPRAGKTKPLPDFVLPNLPSSTSLNKPYTIAVVGAGVAGLSCAYALAVRGHRVTIFDKAAPLAGASGNVRGVLAPKLTALGRLASNLHTIGYLASCRFYPSLSEQTGIEILQTTGALDLLVANRVTGAEVNALPPEFATLLTEEHSQAMTGTGIGEAIFVPQAGLIDTAHFAKAVLGHPNIIFETAQLQDICQHPDRVTLTLTDTDTNTDTKTPLKTLEFDHVVLAMALDTCDFLGHIKPFNYSRGQVSWFEVHPQIYDHLPSPTLKYGGYCAKFEQDDRYYVMIGASFVRDTLDITVNRHEHEVNVADFCQALPKVAAKFTDITPNSQWHGRARLRSQTVDYLPLVGQVWQNGFNADSRVWTFSALGSKGYAYAPIGSELLAGLVCGEILPLSQIMVEKLSPNRKILQR